MGREYRDWEKSLLQLCGLSIVGGTVRDLLLGICDPVQDEDYLVTGIELDRLVGVLEGYGKTNMVGKSFGVIKFKQPEGGTVDISLPRSEVSTGPGHRDFSVSFDASLSIEDDLGRRDFTVNSMALRLNDNKLIDPLGGRADLESRILRVNRESSFEEDPLRILRGVQFMARFGLKPDDMTLRLMTDNGDLLASVSPERIREELGKMIILSEKPSAGFRFMQKIGLLEILMPELDRTFGVEQNEFHPDDIFEHSIKSCDSAEKEPAIRWSALLHDLGKVDMRQVIDGRVVFYRHEEESAAIAESILSRLRFPNGFIARVTHLIRNHMFHITEEWSDGAVRRFISRVGADSLDDLYALRKADVLSRGDRELMDNLISTKKRTDAVLAIDASLKRDDLEIDGTDIMGILDIGPGPRVGEILDILLEKVLDDPELNCRERLVEIVEGMR